MDMKRFTRKQKVAAAALIAVLAVGGGGIAFAYFTSGGSGTGSVPVGSGPTDAFTITTPGPTTPLLPGSDPETFDVSVTNTSGEAAYVGPVSISIPTESNGDAESGGADLSGCQASWFTIDGTMNFNGVVGAGATVTASSLDDVLPTISMPSNLTTDQDACQGSSIDIAFSA